MSDTNQISEAARLLGSRGGSAPKTITEADRERRRRWCAGLAELRRQQRDNHEIAALLQRDADKTEGKQ
jgi:hypothetical protein